MDIDVSAVKVTETEPQKGDVALVIRKDGSIDVYVPEQRGPIDFASDEFTAVASRVLTALTLAKFAGNLDLMTAGLADTAQNIEQAGGFKSPIN